MDLPSGIDNSETFGATESIGFMLNLFVKQVAANEDDINVK